MVKRNQFAKKSLGQNFLTDPVIIKRIVDAIGLAPNDRVVEIGPGRGALTERLVSQGSAIVAIELDRNLVPQLREQFADSSSFSVYEADALDVDFATLISKFPSESAPVNDEKAKLVANLPYYISTAILQRLSEQRDVFSTLVLMFQREVVERISAKPGDSDRGFLTVLVESAFSVERLFDVPPTSFDPQPKVWSSVVRLTPKPNVIVDESHFRKLVSNAFAQKRKTIFNNLKNKYQDIQSTLNSAGVDPIRRAETLELTEWINLHEYLRRK